MKENKEISLKEVFQTLSLFFILSVVSVVMIFSKFEQGVKDFWENKDEYVSLLDDETIKDIIDLDNVKTSGDVCEFDKKQLINEYIEKEGELEVFNKLFEAYMD